MAPSILFLVLFLGTVSCSSRTIFLQSGALDTSVLPSTLEGHPHSSTRVVRSEGAEELLQWIVHVKGPITSTVTRDMEKFFKIPLQHYLPHNSFLVLATKERMKEAKELSYVLWTAPFLSEYKLSPNLANFPLPGFEPLKLRVLIESHFTPSLQQIIQSLEASRVFPSLTFRATGSHEIMVTLPSSQVAQEVSAWLAQQSQIHWIEPVAILTTNAKSSVPLVLPTASGPGLPLTGKNQAVALLDTGVSSKTCYIAASRVTNACDANACEDTNGHGTGMASILGGAPTGTVAGYKGAAPDAKIINVALPSRVTNDVEGVQISLASSLSDTLAKAKSNNANIIVSGFAGASRYNYDGDSQSIDKFVAENPNILVVVPAGNTGSNGIASISNAKNVLTVGSTQNTLDGLRELAQSDPTLSTAQKIGLELMQNATTQYFSGSLSLVGQQILSSFSSRGPTFDGRVKPDVVAPGERIGSSNLNDACDKSPKVYTGTSFSAAMVAGAAAVVREYLTSGFWKAGVATPADAIANPPAALIKAILINSGQSLFALDQGGAGSLSNMVYLHGTPDYHSGFGRVSLSSNLKFSGNSQNLWFTPSLPNVTTGATNTVCFSVKSKGSFKVTLVWNDPAASPSTAQALVNNLDLVVSSRASGRVYRPNGLRVADVLNNVEQVSSTNNLGTDNSFVASVTGINVPVGPQGYALVISGDIRADDCSAGAAVICPGNCGGSVAGACGANGVCSCNAGFSGADCSVSVCPGNGCRSADATVSHGICDAETALCTCFDGYSGSDCNTAVTTPIIYQTKQSTLTQGQMIGAAVGGGIFGLVLGGVIGWFIAIKYLERQRRQKREHLMRGGDEGM